MRITCNVEVVNRLLPALNLKAAGKSTHTQLSIGKKSETTSDTGTLCLMMCTAQNRNGSKFKVQNNVQQIFGRFISEGKATVRLKEPEQDLVISKADPLQLKNFLSVLKLGAQGKNVDKVTLSTLKPASSKNVEKPKTILIIKTKKDYPLTTNFPPLLEFLQVSECNLKKVDSRILQLRHLRNLDLTDNKLETVPEDFSKLEKIRELNLSHNQLSSIPLKFCLQDKLKQTLCLLDLGHNLLKFLPVQICELSSLISLRIDGNKLQELPPTIGRMSALRVLSASGNEISTLPAGITQLHLDIINLFGNPFENQTEISVPTVFPEITLVEHCARAIRKYRVSYSDEDLHSHLCRYLDSARLCWCGGYCFRCCVPFTSNISLHRLAGTVLAVDRGGRVTVPIRSFLCSPQCLIRFQINPHAYWRK